MGNYHFYKLLIPLIVFNFSFIKPTPLHLTHKTVKSSLLLHVSAELHHLQGVYTPGFKTNYSATHYNRYTYCIVVISASELKETDLVTCG